MDQSPLIDFFVSDNVTANADVKLTPNTNLVWSMERQCDTTQQKHTSWTGKNSTHGSTKIIQKIWHN